MRLESSTARAVMDQMRRGGRSDLTLLLGEHATSPGFTADESAVYQQLQRAITGGDPQVSEAALRHISGIRSTPMDLAILISHGLDPAVIAFHVLLMGAIALTGSPSIQITTRMKDATPRMTFDIDLGEGVRWSTGSERTMITLNALPETIGTAIASRIEAKGLVPLPLLVSHPLLDALDLKVERIKTLEWGGAWLSLAEHTLLADMPVDRLLEVRG